jgi:serine/threonine protein kinase
MGEVYRARDTRLGREVALKIISDGAVLDRERLRRFEQEARLAGSLNHPNLVVVHDVGSEGGAFPSDRAAGESRCDIASPGVGCRADGGALPVDAA